jgi:hypothetical protein
MSAATYNLFIDQGSDFALDLVLKENGSAMDLTNYSGRGQLRSTHESTTVAASFTITKTNPTGGALKIELSNSASTAMAAGQYVYDIEIFTNADGVVKRIMQGNATVNPEVTRS